MTNRISIRPARPDDAPLAAAIFRLSLDHLADYLFGPDGRATEVALMRLFSLNAGRFGYEHAFVAELNRRPLGMLVAFPGSDINRLNLAVVRYLPRALGWRMFGFMARGLTLAGNKEAETDEYLVSNIGVLPAAQGHGLGKRLLLQADEQARNLGLKKVSLMVALENHTAQRLYKRNGYKIVFTKHDKNPFASYHRMVKELITACTVPQAHVKTDH
ncbi:MAG: N-acetyltransferase [Anaerolineaceae bacterium]|nr:MAG: N-acetyltransferase [Anaerolineaceae bacterium]